MGKGKKVAPSSPSSPAHVGSDHLASSWPPLPAPATTVPALAAPAAVTPLAAAFTATSTLHPHASSFVPSASASPLPAPLLPLPPLPSLPSPLTPAWVLAHSPSPVAPIHVSSPAPASSPSLLYSPTVGSSPSLGSAPADVDSTLMGLRSAIAYCMDRFQAQEHQIITLTRQHDDLSRLLAQQNAELHALRTGDTNKDILIRTMSEEIRQLRTELEEHSHEVPMPLPITEIREKMDTIQSEVQRHSEWVEVARKAPPRPVAVSETIAEAERRTQRSLNLRVRGIEKAASVTPLQQAVEFVTQTMDIADHGIVAAHRAGGDPARPQPLIMRFRDAEARLAVLRRRRRLAEFPQIHLDEDLTPIQWQIYRSLLPQRHTARQEGLWAVIRDGRLITRPLRGTRGGAADRESERGGETTESSDESSDEGRQSEKEA